MTSRPRALRRAVVAAATILTIAAPRASQTDWRRPAREAFDVVWATIAESYYDPTFGGLDWPAVRRELQPRIEGASTPDAAREVIREMLRRLGRSHFMLIPAPAAAGAWPGPAMIPIDVRVLDAGVVVTHVEPASPATQAGIVAGDLVVAIDGQTFGGGARGDAPEDRRRRLTQWQVAFRALHGAPGSPARLALRSARGGAREVVVTRVMMPGEFVALGNVPPLSVHTEAREIRTRTGRTVGVIAFTAWMGAVAAPIDAAVDRFRQVDGLVIDLRGNPGGLADMIRGLAGHFLATPALLGRIQMRGVQLELRANPRRSTRDGRRVEPYDGPVALLVDELTASASECFAGGMQSLGRVRVFGVPTAGQALPASTKSLPTGDVLLYAVGDFETSTGVRLEAAGVQPDQVVRLSPERLSEDPDPVLTEALGWLEMAPRTF